MSGYFFDTSALVKPYHAEAGTSAVDRIINEEGAELLIARLTLVEMISVFAIKVRTGEFDASSNRPHCPFRLRRPEAVRHRGVRRAHGDQPRGPLRMREPVGSEFSCRRVDREILPRAARSIRDCTGMPDKRHDIVSPNRGSSAS